MVAIIALGTILFVSLALGVAGESYTWDDGMDFEGGVYDATVWDAEAEGITLTGRDTFWKHRSNPLVMEGSGGAWDDEGLSDPCVVFAKGRFYLYYTGYDGTDYAIGLARSSDGVGFGKYGSAAVLTKGSGYDGTAVREPTVIFEDGIFKMWYTAVNGAAQTIAYATSKDGLSWTKYGSNPVLGQPSTGWGSVEFGDPCVIKVDGEYMMYLSGSSVLNSKLMGIATSGDGTSWTLSSSNPLVSKAASPNFGQQEICDVAVVKDGPLFRLYFTGRNGAGGNYKIGYGESHNGLDWDLMKSAYLDVGSSGTFDDTQTLSPGVLYDDGVIYMYYNGDDTTKEELGLATWKSWIVNEGLPTNPILGTGGTYDSTHLLDPCVLKSPSGVYTMFYGCYGGGSYPYAIAKATSSTATFSSGSKYTSNPVLSRGTSDEWDDDRVGDPSVIYEYGVYKMWYAGNDGNVWKIGYATSPLGNTWTKYGSNPVFSGTSGKWDASGVYDPWVIKIGGTYHMWYGGYTGNSGDYIGHATSTDGITWTKDGTNPVLTPDPDSGWEKDYVQSPTVLWENGQFVMYYSGTYQLTGKQRVGRAFSDDGSNWVRDRDNPILDWGNSTVWDDNGVSLGTVLVEGGYHHIYYQGHSGSNWLIGYATYATTKATYTTPILDASDNWPVKWGRLSWDAELPLGTYLKVQVATNNGGTIWEFVGPDGSRDTYFTASDLGMHLFQSGKFIRVKAYFETDDMTEFMPLLRSITVTFSQRTAPSPPLVTVTSPNGGEDWMKTKDYPITWTSQGNLFSTSLSIEYSTDNGTTWTSITSGTADKGTYKWTVPNSETSGALIKVTITDMDGVRSFDISDATFAIDPPAPKAGEILFPSEGDAMSPGTTTLSWNVQDPWGLAESPLTLELTTDGGLTWSTVAERMPFSDGIQWEVPDLEASSDTCRLRLIVHTWLGDFSTIESGAFSIDVMPPQITLQDIEEKVTVDEEVEIGALVKDDIGNLDVILHVEGTDDERKYPMTKGNDGTWTHLYIPVDGDIRLWITASDGPHETASVVYVLDVREAAADTSATSGLALELVIAAGLAVVLLLAVVLIRRRS